MVKPRLDDPLTAEKLRDLLDYIPAIGVFLWRHRQWANKDWNTRYAGKPAGTPTVPKGYVQILVRTRLYLAHRLAFLWMTGRWPAAEIDHADNNPANNAWSNLREASRSQNAMNYRRRTDNTSGYKGVQWEKRRQYWYFVVETNGRREIFPNYATAEEAHAARLQVIRRLHGAFARHD